jgi:hypothetical protein
MITHHLHHQFNNWYGVVQACFGEQPLLAKEVWALTNMNSHMMLASKQILNLVLESWDL